MTNAGKGVVQNCQVQQRPPHYRSDQPMVCLRSHSHTIGKRERHVFAI